MRSSIRSSIQIVSLEQVIEQPLLRVAPDTSALAVVRQMSQTSGQMCVLAEIGQIQIDNQVQLSQTQPSQPHLQLHPQPSCNYALVVADEKLQGIFTERDLVRLVATGAAWEQAAIADVMTHPVISLSASDATNIFTILLTMQQYRIRHLPILDDAQHLIGVVTQASIRNALQPLNFMKLRRVEDVMTPEVVQAAPDLNLLQLAQCMTDQRISCIVITTSHADPQLPRSSPIGIVTERDIIQFQAIGLDLADVAAHTVMSAPLFLIRPSDSLWVAHQEMQRRHTRRLVVADDMGQLAGIITQSNLLRVLDPLEMLTEIEQLQQLTETQTVELLHMNQRLQDDITERRRLESALHNANHFLEERVGLQAAQLVQINAELRYERDCTAAVLNTVGALVIVINRQGRIVRVNHTCERVTGYLASEMINRHVWDFLLASDSQETIQLEFEQLIQEQTSRHFETYWVAKDGTHVLIAWSNTILENESSDVEYIIATGIDITEQRTIEQRLEQQNRQNHLFAEMTRKISRSLRLDEILSTAATEVLQLLRCDRVLMIRLQPEGTGIPVQEATMPQQQMLRDDHRAAPLFQADYLNRCNQASVAAIYHLQQLDNQPAVKQVLEQLGVRAQLIVSIRCANQPWGLLVAHQCDRPRIWSQAEIDLMQQLANQIGVAVSQAQFLNQLENLVQQRTEQLTQTNEQLHYEISDRIKTEEALRESQQKLADILNIADVAIISINHHQRIEMFNQGAVQIFGYTFPEVVGQPLDILLPEAFRQIHREHIRQFETSPIVSRRMAERSSNVVGRRKTGEVFPAEASISKLQTKDGALFTVILKDITERQQAEQALRASEARFRSSEAQLRLTTDALPVLISYVDAHQHYVFNNQAYEDWFQQPVSSFRDRHLRDVLGDDYYQQIQPYIDGAMAGDRVCFESQFTPQDGQVRYLETTYIPHIDDEGTIKGFFGLSSDISDRKATQQIKDEFVSVVSHELRTPLTSIHGSLKLLATGQLGQLSAQGEGLLQIALKNTERLTRLINDVLDLERIDLGKISMSIQVCNAGELLLQAAQSVQSMADERQISLSTTPADMAIRADSDHILQTLINLLSNAIKFSPSGSTIRLTATQREHDVLFQVSDQGRGIPPDKLESIFERFHQVDASDSRKRGGTGLGLSICQKIVQGHGGHIWVESTLGEGSTFYFTLPMASELSH